MSGSVSQPAFARIVGWLLIAVGISVFAIRLQHAGPYALPRGGNLFGGVSTLVLGLWLVRPWLGSHALAAPLRWTALLASPIALFLGLYATMAEIEEVVVLKATDRAGQPADLRLWIVDHDATAWVTMPASKADEHNLADARVELLRAGELRCVVATRVDERETVNRIHRLRHERYAVQRFATVIGMFGRDADPSTVTLRLDPCPD